MAPAAACACLVVAVLWCGKLHAVEWGGALALHSDYVFRGVSHTEHEPAAQAGVHARFAEHWFASAWASNVSATPAELGHAELNLSLGRGWDLSPDWSVSAAFVRYAYPGASERGRYDMNEWSASLIFADRFALTASLAPDAPLLYGPSAGSRYRATALEASMRAPLAGPVSLVAAAGHYDTTAPDTPAYFAAHLGLSAQLRGFELSLAYFAVDSDGRRRFGPAAADGRWVLSVVWRYSAN